MKPIRECSGLTLATLMLCAACAHASAIPAHPPRPEAPAENAQAAAPATPPAATEKKTPPTPAARADISSMTAEEATALTRRIIPAVERLRGLKFKEEVPVHVVDDAAARDYFKSRVEEFWPQQQIQAEQKAYILLGLLPPGTDMFSALLGVLEEQAGGYYDPESNTFFVLGDMPRTVAPVLIAHELTHALDDQYFSLDTLLKRVKADNDRSAALSAVMEGSGTLVMSRYLLEEIQAGRLSMSAMTELQQSEAGRAEKLKAAPVLLQRALVGPYILGQSFLLRGDLAKLAAPSNTDDIDRAFKEPPRSFEQILHPEKYWDQTKRDEPITVALPDLSAALGEGWTKTAGGTLGELFLTVMTGAGALDTSSPSIAFASEWTTPAASGWGGDGWQLYEKAGRRAAVLATIWDTENDAEEFLSALQPADDRSHLRRGKALVVIAGDAAALTQAVADEVFKALDAAGGVAAGESGKSGQPKPSDCPSPRGEAVCTMIYAPVSCKDCTYSNNCFAAAAGWDVKKDCRRIEE